MVSHPSAATMEAAKPLVMVPMRTVAVAVVSAFEAGAEVVDCASAPAAAARNSTWERMSTI